MRLFYDINNHISAPYVHRILQKRRNEDGKANNNDESYVALEKLSLFGRYIEIFFLKNIIN